MVDQGRGVARDPVQAYMWMLLAAANGDQQASAGKSAIGRRLNPTQIGRALDMFHRWQVERSSLPE